MDYLRQNAASISAAASLATLLVWLVYLVYAHLLYRAQQRQHAASVRIMQARGRSLESVCLIVNLGHETIFVERILAVVRTPRGSTTVDWTDDALAVEAGERSRLMRHGQLGPGDCMAVGTFRKCLDLLESAEREKLGLAACPKRAASTQSAKGQLELRIVAHNGPDTQPVGALRTFRIGMSERALHLEPETAETRMLHSARERRTAAAWLQLRLDSDS